MDRCCKIEHARFFGGLASSGEHRGGDHQPAWRRCASPRQARTGPVMPGRLKVRGIWDSTRSECGHVDRVGHSEAGRTSLPERPRGGVPGTQREATVRRRDGITPSQGRTGVEGRLRSAQNGRDGVSAMDAVSPRFRRECGNERDQEEDVEIEVRETRTLQCFSASGTPDEVGPDAPRFGPGSVTLPTPRRGAAGPHERVLRTSPLETCSRDRSPQTEIEYEGGDPPSP